MSDELEATYFSFSWLEIKKQKIRPGLFDQTKIEEKIANVKIWETETITDIYSVRETIAFSSRNFFWVS